MHATDTAPNVSIKNFKRTKILATVGPSTNSYEAILDLIKAGANGIRLNFSHGTHEERNQQIKWIRQAAQEYGKPVAIIQDLQGPKVRLGDFDDIVNAQKGQTLGLKYQADYMKSGFLPTQFDLSRKVKRGERILFYDGKVRAKVTSVKEGVVYVEFENDGILIKRKGINLPDTNFSGDIITAKDKADLIYGSTQDMDFVALSFIQTANDIVQLRKLLKNMGSTAKVIAKIETKAAVDNLEHIIKETDAVMVARGDLAVETLAESVPVVQRKIIGLGQAYAKPTIVATQLLASMTETPEPSRAEVSDVAAAVIIGADCVMLSDETASGKHPTEAVVVMKKIIRYTEKHMPLKVAFPVENEDNSRQAAICESVIGLAERINAKAIVAETKSGATAMQISCRRPNIPIIAVTNDKRTAQQLAIVYDIKSYVRPADPMAASKLTNWLSQNRVLSRGDVVVTASGQHPGVVGTTDTIKVRVIQ